MKTTAKQAAKKLRDKYGDISPTEIAELLNVTVIQEDLGDIDGYYNRALMHDFIHVNEAKTDTEKNFIIAHELGHVLLHAKTNTTFLKSTTFTVANKQEMQANLFAMHLLYSDIDIDDCKHLSVEQISALWGVSVDMVNLRIM